jgi:cation transport ATPase
MKQIVIETTGANCPSCAFTIERLGRKIPGVRDIHMDVASRRISVDCESEDGTVQEQVMAIVRRLGYDARPVPTGPAQEAD